MRTLSSTLLAAQKSSSCLPYVKVEILDRVAGITRLNWARLYSGSEPDFYHAATMPGDGSLMRARVDPASYQLYRQRIDSPGPGSDFSPWTGVCTVSSASGIALASRGFKVLLFYVDTDQKTVLVRESTDYGATFGSPTTITTAASTVGWLAAAINDSDVVCLFYSVAGTVYAVKRTGGLGAHPPPGLTAPPPLQASAASIRLWRTGILLSVHRTAPASTRSGPVSTAMATPRARHLVEPGRAHRGQPRLQCGVSLPLCQLPRCLPHLSCGELQRHSLLQPRSLVSLPGHRRVHLQPVARTRALQPQFKL